MNAARRCLLELDIAGMRAWWQTTAPQLAQLDDFHTLVAIHMARTRAESVPLRARLWSHGWLTERGYRSQLPDELRLHPVRPVVVEAVGIACSANSPALRPISKIIERKISDKVAEAYADGCRDPIIIRQITRAEHDRQKRYFAELIRDGIRSR